ncbi:MAG: type II secretion system protein [Planctomycetes bacterium]|nr:type II secretion system protein [Planctomycetota bacterium]
MKHLRRQSGFTLIELLVVMALTTVLGSLALPAVQQERGAARWPQCKSNHKPIGLAQHGSAASSHALRPGYIDWNRNPNLNPDNDKVCSGWTNDTAGAGGSLQPDSSGPEPGGTHGRAVVSTYNSSRRPRPTDISGGLGHANSAGKRSSHHSAGRWTGTPAPGLCPSRMADLRPELYGLPPGPTDDNTDLSESHLLIRAQATHRSTADFPIYAPETFYRYHQGECHFVSAAGSFWCNSRFINRRGYQGLVTVAGAEVAGKY